MSEESRARRAGRAEAIGEFRQRNAMLQASLAWGWKRPFLIGHAAGRPLVFSIVGDTANTAPASSR